MANLKAWLRPNYLAQEEKNSFVASVVLNGSLTTDDIIQALKQEGMEIKEETARDIISRFNRKVSEKVLEGYSVNTDLVYMRPNIKGVFTDKTFNPKEQSVYVNITQGAELRKAIAQTTVEILGQQAEPIAIFGITDKATAKTDGTLTKGKNAEIKGAYIKVIGDDPKNGVYFTNIDTKVVTKVAAEDIVINDPSKLMILVPSSLVAGSYELSVSTQYANSATLLKQTRTVVLDTPITIA